tara:strand:- start:64 stop:474 length:411 start_codon:yes stop_codon:yes gene_type:complete
MNKLIIRSCLLGSLICSPLFLSSSATAAPSAAVTELLTEYQQRGAGNFSVSAGAELWSRNTEGRQCTSCHSDDPTAVGQHQKTLKPIDPLAPSVKVKRLTEVKTINKWLLRNCKWTLDRECTAQEKGDFLTWLSQQ